MDTNKKFLFINKDETSGEYDGARMFPVSSLQGIQELDATSVTMAFSDQGQADDTFVDITVTSGKAKQYIKDLVENINFAKQSTKVRAMEQAFTSLIGGTDKATEGLKDLKEASKLSKEARQK